MDAVLQVRLLGGFQLHWCGRLLAGFKAARLQVLLAYVLLHRQAPIERSKMAFLLWPDSTEAQAQTNLRRELHNLREALPEAARFVDSAGRTLHWRADAPATVDLIDFEACLEEMRHTDADPSRRRRPDCTDRRIRPSLVQLVKGAKLKVYPGESHGICSTLKDEVNADLLEFLRT